MRSRSLFLIVVVAMAMMPLAATSQGMPPMPATPVPGEAPVGTLAEFNLRQLPTPHAEVWFIRMELEPGGKIPASPAIGPLIMYIESGELALTVDGPVMLPGADRAESPGEMTLATGDSLQLTRETTAELRNDSDAPVSFLTFMTYAAEMEGEGAGGGEPTGLSQMGISIGTAEFMDVPATVRIERVVFEPGTTVEPELAAGEEEMRFYSGMDLGAIETGSAKVELEYTGRESIFWPGMLDNQMGGPQFVPFTTTLQMETGDAYAFHGSTLTWTVTGDEPLTILRVVIHPMPMPME
jgi:hypothetical protein